MSNNKKYKLYKNGKKVVAIGLALSLLTSAGIIKMVHDYSTGETSVNEYVGESTSSNFYVDSYDEYLDVQLSNEKQAVMGEKTSTKIYFNNSDYTDIIEEIDNSNYDFSMSEFYDLDNNLNIYNKNNYNKKQNSDVITNGNLDSDKLYNIVLKNNKEYMNNDKDSINVFFSETTDTYIRKICDLIAKVYNNNNRKNYASINEISDTLTHLKIFQNNTTSASAYVSDDLVFAFNPTMMGMFSDMQEIRGNSQDGVSIDETVFVHEIEHLFQNASNDFNNDNGLETGFCRKYENVNVNSLWNSWLLEGSAELKMAQTLNTTPKNYDKKISYIRSYNLSRLFDNNYNIDDIVNASFSKNIEDAYTLLNITNEKSKKEFLELMYSIEITQSDVEDFWQYYQDKTKITLTTEEKESLRMDIRTEAIKKLSKTFYEGLATDIKSGKIKDLETTFYLMRLWELDCCNHLDYTNKQGFEHAKDFLVWQDGIEKKFLEVISNSNNISYTDLLEKFDNYHMSILTDSKEIQNADFSNYGSEKSDYLLSSFNSYSITHFSKVNTMVDYINSISKSKN